MKKTFEGPSSGPGASYAWNGNNAVGEGRLTIVESKPAELITMKLEFSRPFKCTNEVNFKLEPSPGGTRVSWIMDGKNNFMTKAMSLFMNMDKMVGKDFEQGLANLSGVAQGRAPELKTAKRLPPRHAEPSSPKSKRTGARSVGALVTAHALFECGGPTGSMSPICSPSPAAAGRSVGERGRRDAAQRRRGGGRRSRRVAHRRYDRAPLRGPQLRRGALELGGCSTTRRTVRSMQDPPMAAGHLSRPFRWWWGRGRPAWNSPPATWRSALAAVSTWPCGMRTGMLALSSPGGNTLVAWKKDNQIGWQ